LASIYVSGILGQDRPTRVHRGGDRQANATLYRIALSRLRWDARTRDHLTRINEGKTRREAIRCLKRDGINGLRSCLGS
jgi:transposase